VIGGKRRMWSIFQKRSFENNIWKRQEITEDGRNV
jgi:hypothetical protein